jgi:glycosyltransferase involved in cell wall biosynthesis
MTNNQPLVSAIIIFLNEERFLQEAITSIFVQSYNNWELLIVDDGSSDNSTAIARACAAQHPDKVRYLEHENHANRGMSASRNLGVRNARGKYIAYLDGDDVWLPEKLERQVAILEAHPEACLVHGPLTLWYSWNAKPEDQGRDTLYGVGADGRHPYSDSLVPPPKLLTLFLRDEQYIPSGFLARQALMERVGAYEEVFSNAYSDAVSLVKLCLSQPVYVVNDSSYLYRKHAASATYRSWQQGKEEEERRFFVNWLEGYLASQRINDLALWYAVRRLALIARYPALHRLLRSILQWLTAPQRWLQSILARRQSAFS